MSEPDPRTREELLAEIERLQHAVLHDPLTGVANRALFSDRLERAVAYARRTRHRFAVVVLDLDGFKDVNDHYGHAAGDTLLQATAQRLTAAVRESDTVARLGGDEFGMVLFDADRAGADNVVSKLRVDLTRSISVDDAELSAGVSAGTAVFPDDATDPESLLRAADDAMYVDKRERDSSGAVSRALGKLGGKLRRQ
jgi:diguanylate cyclase (GGDEF)-like protein